MYDSSVLLFLFVILFVACLVCDTVVCLVCVVVCPVCIVVVFDAVAFCMLLYVLLDVVSRLLLRKCKIEWPQ